MARHLSVRLKARPSGHEPRWRKTHPVGAFSFTFLEV